MNHIHLLRLAALSSVALSTSLQAAESAKRNEDQLHEVLVYGSRSTEEQALLEKPSPVTSIGEEVAAAIGAQSAQELVLRLPAALNSTQRATSVNNDLMPNGLPFPSALVNLRDLGTDRTLVLVNGRRHVAGTATSSAVDINTIPEALIERVDVLTGSATGEYGGDAAAGVLNFVLKKQYEGLEGSAQLRQYGGGLGRESAASLLGGMGFGPDKRGNVTIGVDWVKRAEINAVNSGVRFRNTYRLVENPKLYIQNSDLTPALFDAGARPGDFIPGLDPGITSLLPAARQAEAADPRINAFASNVANAFAGINGGFGIDIDGDGLSDPIGGDLNGDGRDDCETVPGFNGSRLHCWTVDEQTGDIRAFRSASTLYGLGYESVDGEGVVFPSDELVILDPQYERASVSLNAGFDLTDDARLFLESKFVDSTSANKPVGGFDVYTYFTPIQLDNPFIPATTRTLLTNFQAANPDVDLGHTRLNTTREIITNAGRDRQTSKTLQLVTGVEGDPTPNLHYEAAAQYGRTLQRNPRLLIYFDRFFSAIDVVADPVTGAPVCRSSVDPTALPATFYGETLADFRTFEPGDGQCRPLNVFATGGVLSPDISPDARAFISNPDGWYEVELEQTVFSAGVSGDLGERFKLPAGSIGFRASAEHRRESSRASAADDLVNGLIFGWSFTPVAGSFDVDEVALALDVPLIRGNTLAHDLTLSGSARYADYSSVGGLFTWSGGIAWAPTPGVRFRGSLARTFRAPTVYDLFQPVEQSLNVGAGYDPCTITQIDLGPSPATRAANCAADGIPAGFPDAAAGTFNAISGGNPDLDAESARTWTAGLVIQPGTLPYLVGTVDYYDIRIEDAIQFADSSTSIAACYDSTSYPDNVFCDQFTRNRDPASPGYLTVNSGTSKALNYGLIETSGLDFTLQYTADLGRRGSGKRSQIGFGLNATRVLSYDTYFVAGQLGEGTSRLGEYQTPKWTGTTDLIWRFGNFDASWNTLYYGEQTVATDQDLPFITTEFGGPDLQLAAAWIHSLSLGYQVSPGLNVRVGANNITNAQPQRFRNDFLPVNAFGPAYFLAVNYKPSASPVSR
ncbi:MAG TPA: TonB-dependent receptor [Povalibacter sp.]|uniref:TonB-dependent receptor domain-containing protein n=1 Tax=Povalibacter sp. TaxID=1962978 RepID=UPI002CB46C74|nr:TonB-dependent receptor [Povalibacter sp.]HMN47460.1 TonB-dependent receptor [Povalibacter sp.]